MEKVNQKWKLEGVVALSFLIWEEIDEEKSKNLLEMKLKYLYNC